MEELKYLDDIIVFIKNSHNSEATLDEICEKMTGKPYDSNISKNQTDGEVVKDIEGNTQLHINKALIPNRHVPDV